MWITELLENNNPMGVSAIAEQLNLPKATVQHFLKNQQSKLIQLENRKWTTRPKEEDIFEEEDLEIINKASLDELVLMRGRLREQSKLLLDQADLITLRIQEKLK